MTFGQSAARLCHGACRRLGWRPGEFWDATPAELALAVQGPSEAGAGADKALIDELMQRFPDETKA